jgi:hypothetical protein
VALTAVHAWPLALDPAGSATASDDTLSHVWIVSWVVHQGLRDPLRLFDANMFWPHPQSLAYTESLIAQGVQAVPLRLLGADPLLTHNLLLLLTYPLAAIGSYLLAFDLTRSRQAAFLAGLVFAFSPLRFKGIVHINVVSTQWLPFVVLFFRRAALRPGRGSLLGLWAAAVLTALSSGYYAVLLALTLAVLGALYLRVAWRRRSLLPLAAALAAATVVVVIATLPHLGIRGLARTSWGPGALQHWSATPGCYLEPGAFAALPHVALLGKLVSAAQPLFPGTATLLLAPLAVGVRRERPRLALALAVTGVTLSFGPQVSVGGVAIPAPFELLRRVPPIDMVRDPGRLAVLAHLGIALLAAGGAAALARRRRGAWWAGAAIALQCAEGYPAGLSELFWKPPPPPAFTSWLARAPRGPVLELPWEPRNRLAGAGLYLYWSTAHWQPLVNGLGTFQPRGNFGLALLAGPFPSARSVRLLRGEGVRYVVLHTQRLAPDRRQNLLATELPRGVRLAAEFGADRVYEIDPEGPTERRPKDLAADRAGP